MKKIFKEVNDSGQYAQRFTNADIDRVKTKRLVIRVAMKSEKEGLITAAQDNILETWDYYAITIKTNQTQYVDCKIKTLSNDNFVSGCPSLTAREYKERQVKIGHYFR